MRGKRILGGRLYEDQFLHLSAGTFSTAWLCRGSTEYGHDHNHNPRGDDDRAGNYTCDSGGDCDAAATDGSSRDGYGCTRTGICVDTWILALDGNTVRLDARQLGGPPHTNCRLGGRAMGTTAWRMGLGARPLAIRNGRPIVLHGRAARLGPSS